MGSKNTIGAKKLTQLRVAIKAIKSISPVGRAYLLGRIFTPDEISCANRNNYEVPRDEHGYDREFYDNYCSGTVFRGSYSKRYIEHELILDGVEKELNAKKFI